MTSRSHRYYILLEDQLYELPNTGAYFQFNRGTLLRETRKSHTSVTCVVIGGKLSSDEKIPFCPDDLKEINEQILNLLLPVKDGKRYGTYTDQLRMKDGLELTVDDKVLVTLKHDKRGCGVLSYRGPIEGKKGIYFGVELNAPGIGNSNGYINKKKYFPCKEGHGFFAALDQISLIASASSRKKRLNGGGGTPSLATSSHKSFKPSKVASLSKSQSSTLPRTYPSNDRRSFIKNVEPYYGITRQQLKKIGVFLGSNVSIFVDWKDKETEVKGVVRFVGRLPGSKPDSDIFAGISLQDPAGSGCGVYQGYQLFETEPGYAALVPLSGVMLLSNEGDEGSSKTLSPKYTRTSGGGSSLYRKSRGDKSDPVPGTSLQRAATTCGTVSSGYVNSAAGDSHYSKNCGRFSATRTRKRSVSPVHSSEKASSHGSLDLIGSHTTGNGVHSYLEPGTMVQLNRVKLCGSTTTSKDEHIYGVVRWLGRLPSSEGRVESLTAGVELDEDVPGTGDGKIEGKRYFSGPHDRCVFVPPSICKPDSRFDAAAADSFSTELDGLELDTSPTLPGIQDPPIRLTENMTGYYRGIQGLNNSCYLDATLFSLFSYSSCLDSIVLREKTKDDISQYNTVQKILMEDIVNPLRRSGYVSSSKIAKLRSKLDKLGSVEGLTYAEKDPEEFICTLFSEVLKAEPFFKLRQPDGEIQPCYFHQIFIDIDDKMTIPDTQALLERSFIADELKFVKLPTCLILQMPRFGTTYKMYNRIRPSLTINLNDLTDKAHRLCSVCGDTAYYECRNCSLENCTKEAISSFCGECVGMFHRHPSRHKHLYKKLRTSSRRNKDVLEMELFSVVCIESSHYVSFTKCGRGPDARWCFFDSMASHVEKDCMNIPQLTECEDFYSWLLISDREMMDISKKDMEALQRRLYCDAFLCMYQPAL